MVRENAAISVLGAVLLVGIIVVAAGVVGFVVVDTITNASYNGPQASLDISNVRNIMYHSGGETIDWATTKILYNGEDITKYCKMAEYAGDSMQKSLDTGVSSVNNEISSKTWNTGQVLILYKDEEHTVDAKEVSIVATDGTQEFLVYKGAEYFGSTEVELPKVWIVTVYYQDEAGNELAPSREIQVAQNNRDQFRLKTIDPIYIEDYTSLTPSLKVEDIHGNMDYVFKYTSAGLSVTLHLLGGDLTNGFGTRYYDDLSDIRYSKSQLSSGTVITLPPAEQVVRDGYEFKGWYDNPECSGSPLTSVTMGTESIELYPKWEKLYSVKLYTNGGELSSTEFTKIQDGTSNHGPIYRESGIHSGDTIKLPDASSITKENFIFKGWNDNPQGTGKFYSGEIQVTDDLELYLIWEEKDKYTIKFNSNGGSEVSPITVYNGTIPQKPTDPTYNGENDRFIGWFDEEGNEYDFNKPLDGDITLTAKWKYKITFDANGSSWSDSSTKQVRYTSDTGSGCVDDIPVKPNEPANQVFGGWFYKKIVNGEEVEVQVDSFTEFNSDTVVYAKWVNKKQVKVTFNPNGGTIGGSSNNVTKDVYVGNTVTAPTGLDYTPNNFLGWYKEDGTKFDFNSPVSETTNLIAKWSYQVTFKPDGGVMPDEDKTRYTDINGKLPGKSYSNDGIPEYPTKSGYNCDGWYYRDANNVEHEFTKDTVLTQATEVYAKWSPIYTVTFNPNGGTINGHSKGETVTLEVKPNSVVTNPGITSSDGNIFAGWYDQNGNLFDFSKPVTGNTVLTAKWNYKITFHPEGGFWYDSNGKQTSADVVKYTDINGYLSEIPSDPGKNQKLFRGWYTQKSGAGTQVTTLTKFTSATDVYAKWVSGCRVIFHPCGHKWPSTASSTYAGTTKIITVDVEGENPTALDAIKELLNTKLQIPIRVGNTYGDYYMPVGTAGNDWRELNIITQPYDSKWEPSPYWLDYVYSNIGYSKDKKTLYGDHTRLSWTSHSGLYPIVFGADDHYLEERAMNELVDEGLIISKKCKYV